MRREFSDWAAEYARIDPKFLFLTGDLGFMALEALRDQMGARFVNAGVSEQNLVAVAASLAKEGLHPLCYSIAPFLVFRPYEQIRLDVALHSLPVRFVGNGGGYGYGIMGASHHALQDVAGAADYMMRNALSASYLRLGAGLWPAGSGVLPSFAPVRTLQKITSPRLSVVGIGPVLLNALPILRNQPVDCFAVSVLPCAELPEVFVESVAASGTLWVIEEHTARGGLGEFLCAQLARLGVHFRFHHACASGYPDGLYGSQKYHQNASGLDTDSLKGTLEKLLNPQSL